ncbi:MAG: CDP-alcohol phosphatidyltransferase family protein [Candidatus Aminicenantales bacterium]
MAKPRGPGSVYSDSNMITLLRLGGSLVFFVLAAVRGNPTDNYIGLGIHWLGDFCDGWWARKTRQETMLGAEIDIIADRVEVLFFFVNFIRFNPGLAIPSAIYVLDFAFVDFYLSYQFPKYGIISPNYFFKVDRTVFALNFSPVGKFVNSTVVTLGLIFLPGWRAAVGVLAGALIVVKTYSIRRLILLQRNPGNGIKPEQEGNPAP